MEACALERIYATALVPDTAEIFASHVSLSLVHFITVKQKYHLGEKRENPVFSHYTLPKKYEYFLEPLNSFARNRQLQIWLPFPHPYKKS